MKRIVSLAMVGLFCLSVSSMAALTVSAGKDTTTRLGLEFKLQGVAQDPEQPDADIATMWTQLAGPTLTADVHWYPDAVGGQVTFPAPGVYRLRLEGKLGNVTKYDTVVVTVNDSIPFKVLKPTEGEKLLIGGKYTIRWQIDPPQTSVVVALSIDGGASFPESLVITPERITADTLRWTIPSTLKPNDECQIMVRFYIGNKKAYSGIFSLTNNPNAAVRDRVINLVPASGGKLEAYSVDGRRLTILSPQNSVSAKSESKMMIIRNDKTATRKVNAR